LKRCKDCVQNDQFVNNLLQGRSKIFEEIRKFRGITSTYSSRIDEEFGAHNIAVHFADIYENLYTKVESGCQNVQDGVNNRNGAQIYRVTEEAIKDVINLIKAKKNDAIFDISSDC
jgi:hypothetical protein